MRRTLVMEGIGSSKMMQEMFSEKYFAKHTS